MSQNLIPRERAQQALAQGTLTAQEIRTLDDCVAAASEAVRGYCRRDFSAQEYDDLLDGSGTPELLLGSYPILHVSRVATTPTAVMTVTNTSTAHQRATVEVTSEGLTLTRTTSGVVTGDLSVTWASAATLGAVATAINALGNGWSAVARTEYASWPSADLRALQGALGCARGRSAPLWLHVDEVAAYGICSERGLLTAGAEGWNASGTWEHPYGRPCWVRGWRNYRVVYSAGYESIPEAIREACASWAVALWWRTKRDPEALQVQVAGAGFQVYPGHGIVPPGSVAALLAPYRLLALGGR